MELIVTFECGPLTVMHRRRVTVRIIVFVGICWKLSFSSFLGCFREKRTNFWPKKTTFSAFSNLIHCRPVHHCASFFQQYCQDVKNDENSAIAVCDKNDLLENSVQAHSNQQMGIQKLIGSESCYFGLFTWKVLFWVILVYFGLFWFILVYFGLFRVIFGYFGSFFSWKKPFWPFYQISGFSLQVLAQKQLIKQVLAIKTRSKLIVALGFCKI